MLFFIVIGLLIINFKCEEFKDKKEENKECLINEYKTFNFVRDVRLAKGVDLDECREIYNEIMFREYGIKVKPEESLEKCIEYFVSLAEDFVIEMK